MKNYAALLIMVSLMTAVAPAVVELHLNFDTEEDGLSPALVGTDATLMGNATITTGGQGISGEALQLDGESFAQLMDYKGIGGNDARTVSLWVKTAVNQANGTFFIGWGDTGLGARVRYDLGLQSGTAGQLRNEFNAGAATSATGAPITDDVWHHIAVTYDGNRNVAFYLDGDPYGTAALTWDLATLLTEDVVIGTGIREATEWGALARWTEGLIDDVQIYNTALSQADIEWLTMLNRLVAGAVIVIVLLLASVGVAVSIVIARTIGLGVTARLHVVEIQRILGAPEWLIRRPFVIMGIVQGAIGGVVAGITVTGGAHLFGIVPLIGRSLVGNLPQVTIGLIVLGITLGWWGSRSALASTLPPDPWLEPPERRRT